MTEELQQPAQEPRAEARPLGPVVAPPTPKKSNNSIWIIAGAIILVASICSIICVALFVTGIGKVLLERAPVESVLDAFMQDMLAKDTESAYALFSPRSQRQTPISDLEKLTQGRNYLLFQGYQSLSVENINLSATVGSDPDQPQGTVATVDGVVYYEGGYTGEFDAVLEKVDGAWRIFNFNVNIPPDKPTL